MRKLLLVFLCVLWINIQYAEDYHTYRHNAFVTHCVLHPAHTKDYRGILKNTTTGENCAHITASQSNKTTTSSNKHANKFGLSKRNCRILNFRYDCRCKYLANSHLFSQSPKRIYINLIQSGFSYSYIYSLRCCVSNPKRAGPKANI